MPPPTYIPAMPNSSPHSSDEATHHDTPSTTYTRYSPETAYKKSTNNSANPGIRVNVAIANRTSQQDGDVFLAAPTPTSGRSQLSPTAADFKPGQYNSTAAASTRSLASFNSTGSGQTIVGGVPIAQGLADPQHRSGAAESMRAVGESPVDDVPHLADDLHRARISNSITGSKGQDPNLAFGVFATNESSTRAMRVTGVSSRVSWIDIAQSFGTSQYPSQKGINARDLATVGEFVMAFSDSRDAFRAFREISLVRPDWLVLPMDPKHYALYLSGYLPADVSDYEGQLYVTAYFDGRTSDGQGINDALTQALSSFGNIKAIHTLLTAQGNVRDFRVEYFDTRAADSAFQSLNHVALGPFFVVVERYTPDIAPASPDNQPRQQREQLSMTGRSTVPIDEHDRQMYDLANYGPNHLHRGNIFRGDLNGNHNQVVIARIQAGVDVRTTIMLRNIPNKIDQGMLKAILDETSFGCYDFMYLRIDFANNCNVGYAFINFTDALAIIPFALARAGQRWNRFNSDKVAEISYATIQGRDCLVQKFRNSSVMLEHPTFRPKLYITGAGPDAGQEEKFPGPDNPSKMRRSVENAEHVGLYARGQKPSSPKKHKSHGRFPARTAYPPACAFLARSSPSPQYVNAEHEADPFVGNSAAGPSRLFAPREGQIYRDQQRSRKSQWDKGTTSAEAESYHYRLRDPARSPTFPSQQMNVIRPSRSIPTYSTSGDLTYGYHAQGSHVYANPGYVNPALNHPAYNNHAYGNGVSRAYYR